MIIRNVKATTICIPLEKTISMGGYQVSAREYAMVEIETDEGMMGYGFTFTRGGEVASSIVKHLKPLLMNENPLAIERLWQTMNWNTRYIGRKGLLMRAISAVDIALWDLKGKIAALPIYRLLGGCKDRMPALMACGYYTDGKTKADLADEVQKFAEQGYRHIKIMVGGADSEEDIARIKLAREAIGFHIDLAIDVNGVWSNWKDALFFAERVKDCHLSFIEEPFHPDHSPALKAFANRINTKVAVGETESGRWAFRDLLVNQAADIIRPDATLVGGITEWVKIAHMASAWDITVLPHYFPYVHIQLVAGISNADWVETVTTEHGISNFHQIVKNKLVVHEGVVEVPQQPGLGIDWDWAKIESFTMNSYQ